MGGLFSVFHKKLASKPQKTCDFAYFTSQWGVSSLPAPPWLLLIQDRLFFFLFFSPFSLCFKQWRRQHFMFEGRAFLLNLMRRPKQGEDRSWFHNNLGRNASTIKNSPYATAENKKNANLYIFKISKLPEKDKRGYSESLSVNNQIIPPAT